MCDACRNAREHPLSGRFDAGCEGCSARALSRDQRFFIAAKNGAFTPEYRMALQQLLPKMSQADAHALVRGWATMAPRPQRENIR